MEKLKGLELLHALTHDQFTCKEDCLVTVFHCLMINDGKKCVGHGDEWNEEDLGGGSEILPAGWNADHNVYSLRYISDTPDARFLLKIVKAGNTLLVNVLDVKAENASSASVNVSHHVSENFKEFQKVYINLDDLSEIFSAEVLGGLQRKEKKEKERAEERSSTPPFAHCSRESNQEMGRLLRDPSLFHPIPVPDRVRQDNFPSIGRGDLDPFGGGGSGMLADPFGFPRPGVPRGPGGAGLPGFPRGIVPPGARFDPVGPLGIGRGFSQPNPDHLPPPGYDDMFM